MARNFKRDGAGRFAGGGGGSAGKKVGSKSTGKSRPKSAVVNKKVKTKAAKAKIRKQRLKKIGKGIANNSDIIGMAVGAGLSFAIAGGALGGSPRPKAAPGLKMAKKSRGVYRVRSYK